MGGSDSKKTKTTYQPPEWVERASHEAVQKGREIGRQEYTPYDRDRVAGMSENEQLGMRKAREAVGISDQYIQRADKYATRGAQQFKDADMSQYMNPYIEGALDPAARKIREEGARQSMALDARASSMDAFGGSRAALMRSEAGESTMEGIQDLYKEGFGRAYESAVGIWGDERTRDMEASGRFQMIAGQAQSAAQTDVSTLMTTGALDRGLQQAVMDFDYKQFIEDRDWDFRGLSGLLASIQGTKGSYSTTTTSKETTSEDNTMETIGAVVQIVAAMYSDEGLKDNIIYVGKYMGHKLYTWTWNAAAVALGINTPEFGVLAQEVAHTGCVIRNQDSGYLMVNYRELFGD